MGSTMPERLAPRPHCAEPSGEPLPPSAQIHKLGAQAERQQLTGEAAGRRTALRENDNTRQRGTRTANDSKSFATLRTLMSFDEDKRAARSPAKAIEDGTTLASDTEQTQHEAVLRLRAAQERNAN